MVAISNMLQHASLISQQCELSLERSDLTDDQREVIAVISRNAARYNDLQDDNIDIGQHKSWHHQLRSPLAPIKGYVEILLMDAMGPLTPVQRSIMMRIRYHCDNMTAISDAMVS